MLFLTPGFAKKRIMQIKQKIGDSHLVNCQNDQENHKYKHTIRYTLEDAEYIISILGQSHKISDCIHSTMNELLCEFSNYIFKYKENDYEILTVLTQKDEEFYQYIFYNNDELIDYYNSVVATFLYLKFFRTKKA